MLSFLRDSGCFCACARNTGCSPIFVMMAIFGGLIVLTKGSAVAPFIYTLF